MNNTDGLKHTTITAIAISEAAMSAGGDFYATRKALARFCTEALVDIATEAYVPAKFSSDFPKYRRATRDEAIERICGWVHHQRILAWGKAFEATRQAAIAELPAALESLGAAL